MRVGILIHPEHRWWIAEPKWRAVEEYGFHHAWTSDHLGWRTLVDGPWFGAMPTLTAAATVTTKIRLGTWVASPQFRHPVSFAREIITLDDVCDGRFTLGVGSGGSGDYDQRVMGGEPLSAKEKGVRFGEFVELLDQLLRHDRTSWSGEYFEAVEARNAPGCVQKPRVPFLIAANGPKGMRLAARHGTGWATIGGGEWQESDDMTAWWRGVAEVARKFDDAVEADGRTVPIDRYLGLDAAPQYVLSSLEAFTDALGRAEELGFTDVVAPWPRHDGIYAGSESVLEQVASDVLPALSR
ncbi:luciferase-like monooxygenase [Herbihabitans rhizosphaerae]|uniref:Luciferase-like monooxygenase n=1 Tax=Herbihabitans rhizosphaerae TaxID=1872711 RepID=A0A4Q7L9M6_9PSEU|nr:LLM class flavin-dependent oxidoreductase [Herbihabitans rhizosphaerae]RZS45152.1 luciferase-like monooxygenase [Herbihabitans rhizosphaerae]